MLGFYLRSCVNQGCRMIKLQDRLVLRTLQELPTRAFSRGNKDLSAVFPRRIITFGLSRIIWARRKGLQHSISFILGFLFSGGWHLTVLVTIQSSSDKSHIFDHFVELFACPSIEWNSSFVFAFSRCLSYEEYLRMA